MASISREGNMENTTLNPPSRSTSFSVIDNKPSPSKKLSVIVKTFNEQEKIATTIHSIFLACKGLDYEVIIADSLSTDRTVEIASSFPVKVVQLLEVKERSCGVGPQLGFQYSQGELIYLIDGDMDLSREFLLRAIALLEREPDLAGIGGLVAEEHLVNLDYQSRIRNLPTHLQSGEVDRLNGGGLYRRKAIEDVGYFSNRNQHSFEEMELGLRLQSKGWRLLRLNQVAVKHYGHTVATLTLLLARFRSRYAQGAGELLRVTWGKPYLFTVIKEFRVFLMVIAWWALLLFSLFLTRYTLAPVLSVLSLLPLMIGVMIFRKRSVRLGLYAITSWNVFALGTLLGLMRKQQAPEDPIPSKIISDKIGLASTETNAQAS